MEGYKVANRRGEAGFPRKVHGICSGRLSVLLTSQRRIAQEHEAMGRSASGDDDGRPQKRRRLPHGVQGVHAADMSLVTPENAATRAGWHVTDLGRIIRPMRMRPEHPLPDPQESFAVLAKSKTGGKKRKRVREPPARALRRKIDPTRWNSVHLKGAFLENAIVAPKSTPLATIQPSLVEELGSGSEDTSDVEEEAVENGPFDRASSQRASDRSPEPPQSAPRLAKLDDTRTDFQEETQKSLGLLQALFGDKEDGDWGDQESVGSDVELDDSTHQDPTPTTAIEDGKTEVADVDADMEAPPTTQQTRALAQTTKLKDLFAPREEDGMPSHC